MPQIYPSLISADLLNLQKQINELDAYVDGYHIDIMDFNFVPNLTWGPAFHNAIRAATQKPLHAHLMVCNPEKYIDRLVLTRQDFFSFHLERCPDTQSIDYAYAHELIEKVKDKGVNASVAIKPSTPIDALEPVIGQVNDVILMSVEPGFSGQTFMDITYGRLEELQELKKQKASPCTISIDGGINEDNIIKLAQQGADRFCVASAIFDKLKPADAVIMLRQLAQRS